MKRMHLTSKMLSTSFSLRQSMNVVNMRMVFSMSNLRARKNLRR